MRVLFFGSYDAAVYTRVQALLEGFREHGDEVDECNIPLDLPASGRVDLLRRPWRAPLLVLRLARLWLRLAWRARRMPTPDAVVVGYLGHFDIHLAGLLWPRTPLALDFLISGADTARDRGVRGGPVLRLLDTVDRAAVARADVPFVDTRENLALLPEHTRSRAVVVPVGAPRASFRALPDGGEPPEGVGDGGDPPEGVGAGIAEPPRGAEERLRVIFFGSFTPLQGAITITRAVGSLADTAIDFLIVGRGQDYDAARELGGSNPNVTWVDWLEPDALPRRLAEQHVCLGIFGTGPKALRVVPNKVCHGAAAGCAIVTSDTPPQRRALGHTAAVFVPPGDAAALAEALRSLASDPDRVARLREAAAARAREVFAPEAVVTPLRQALLERVRS